MSELNLKEAEIFEVQESSDGDFVLDIPPEMIEVSEDEVDGLPEQLHAEPEHKFEEDQDQIVVEEPDDLVPGSDAKLQHRQEEQKAVDVPKTTDWINDRDHSKFPQYLDDKLRNIPKHSGETIPGCERAKHYLKDCQREISQAVRDDFGSKIDEMWADTKHKEIGNMINRLEQQLEALRSKASVETRLTATGSCPKCDADTPMWHDTDGDRLICLQCNSDVADENTITKIAGTPVLNVFMSPFERAIVATIINSSVSAGRNADNTYTILKNKYNFTPREELALRQLLHDYGHPIILDRGRLNEATDPASGDGVDWSTQYNA